MLQASLAGYLVCGAFLSMSYFDLFYHLLAIIIILKKIVQVYEYQAVTIRNDVLTNGDLERLQGGVRLQRGSR
jgi:hypothetical protein